MDQSHRRMLVAIGLFVGGVVVGSNPGGGRGSDLAHAAPPPPTPVPNGDAPARGRERGAVAPSLRKLAAHDDDDDFFPPGVPGAPGARCAMRTPDRGDPRARGDTDDPLSGLKMPGLPVRPHPRVLKYVRYFSENAEGRRFFEGALRRSGRYQEITARAFRELGLPVELGAVAMVESGFSPDAMSTAGAAGLWQFMPATARAYNLLVEKNIDERASPWRSTDAAAHHLADLYERFRSWELALAAYNLGYDRLERRLDEYDVDDFWALVDAPGALPKETAHYVPKVLGAAVVLANLETFGFGDVERASALDASELEVPGGTRLPLVAHAAGTSLRALRELNPELLADSAPDRGQPATIHVPRVGLSRARVMLPRLIADGDEAASKVSADFDWSKDDARDGHSTLERTGAGKRSSSLRSLLSVRRVRRPHGEEERRKQLLPSFGGVFARSDDAEDASSEPPPARRADKGDRPEQVERPNKANLAARVEKQVPEAKAHVFYRVTPGDSLRAIAAQFGLTLDQLLAQAHANAPEDILPGTMLKLDVPASSVDKKL